MHFPLRYHSHSLGGLGQLGRLVHLTARCMNAKGDVLLTEIHKRKGWEEEGEGKGRRGEGNGGK